MGTAQRKLLVVAIALTLSASGCAFIERTTVANDGSTLLIPRSAPVVDGTGRYAAFASGTEWVDAEFISSTLNFRDNASRIVTEIAVDPYANGGDNFITVTDLSADARFIALSVAPESPLNLRNVFVYDRSTATLDQVTIGIAGSTPNGSSYLASVSDDGRYVEFESHASNLVTADTNAAMDEFVFDRVLRTTTRISTNVVGGQRAGNSHDGAIAGDGRSIVYHYERTIQELLTDPAIGDAIIVKPLSPPGAPVELDAPKHDAPFDTGNSGEDPAITHDGRYVVYTALSRPNIGQPARPYVVRYDRNTDSYLWLSLRPDGSLPLAGSAHPAISDDGALVAFFSEAEDIAPDGNGRVDAFVRDVPHTRTYLASSGLLLTPGNYASGFAPSLDYRDEPPSLSDDGAYVSFWSYATNLDPAGPTSERSAYLRSTRFVTVAGGLPTTLPDGVTTHVTVTGTGFRPDTQLGISGGTKRWTTTNITYIDDDTMTLDITVDPGATPGPVTIVAINPGGTWGPYNGAANWCLNCLTIT